MPTLQLSDDQVLELVRQLPPARQEDLLRSLLSGRWSTWAQLSNEAQPGVHAAAAQRGQNWDAMTEPQREDFIDDLVHEDRECPT